MTKAQWEFSDHGPFDEEERAVIREVLESMGDKRSLSVPPPPRS